MIDNLQKKNARVTKLVMALVALSVVSLSLFLNMKLLASKKSDDSQLQAASGRYVWVADIDPTYADRIEVLLRQSNIDSYSEGSITYGLFVSDDDEIKACYLLRAYSLSNRGVIKSRQIR